MKHEFYMVYRTRYGAEMQTGKVLPKINNEAIYFSPRSIKVRGLFVFNQFLNYQ